MRLYYNYNLEELFNCSHEHLPSRNYAFFCQFKWNQLMIACKIFFESNPSSHSRPLAFGLFRRKIGVTRIYENVNTSKIYHSNLLWDKYLWIFKPTKQLKVCLFQSDWALFSSGILRLTNWSEGPEAFLLLLVILLMVEYLWK